MPKPDDILSTQDTVKQMTLVVEILKGIIARLEKLESVAPMKVTAKSGK